MHGFNGYNRLKETDTANNTEAEPICRTYCSLTKFDWYWGDIRRSEAEAMVIKHPGTFIIRACADAYSILCVTFLTDCFTNPIAKTKSTNPVSHMRLQHYKGLFSLDKCDYRPLNELPEHCARVGRDKNLFRARALLRDTKSRLFFKKNSCERHS